MSDLLGLNSEALKNVKPSFVSGSSNSSSNDAFSSCEGSKMSFKNSKCSRKLTDEKERNTKTQSCSHGDHSGLNTESLSEAIPHHSTKSYYNEANIIGKSSQLKVNKSTQTSPSFSETNIEKNVSDKPETKSMFNQDEFVYKNERINDVNLGSRYEESKSEISLCDNAEISALDNARALRTELLEDFTIIKSHLFSEVLSSTDAVVDYVLDADECNDLTTELPEKQNVKHGRLSGSTVDDEEKTLPIKSQFSRTDFRARPSSSYPKNPKKQIKINATNNKTSTENYFEKPTSNFKEDKTLEEEEPSPLGELDNASDFSESCSIGGSSSNHSDWKNST